MRPLEAPKLKLEPKGSDRPNRHRKVPGQVKRLRKTTILTRVAELGRMSDVAVIQTSRKEDLVRNLAFSIHQQRLWGALDRLKRSNPFQLSLPPKVEQAIQQSAFKALQEE